MTPSNTPAGSPALTMNSPTGKRVLSLVRGHDFAHPGEEAAIRLVLEPLRLSADTRCLDVGCGFGGTAAYVQQQGWGQVTGIDIDPDNISAARARHAGVTFVHSDVLDLPHTVTPPFDLLYLFNAFFLFVDQPAALEAMRAAAAPAARLVLFDYVDRGGYAEWYRSRDMQGLRSVLDTATMPAMLARAGWRHDETRHLDAEYLAWYEALLTQVQARRDAVIEASSEAFFDYVLARYTQTRDDLAEGRLGGAVFYATLERSGPVDTPATTG